MTNLPDDNKPGTPEAAEGKIRGKVRETIERIKKDGLTYEDLERLRYEFPKPNEEADGK